MAGQVSEVCFFLTTVASNELLSGALCSGVSMLMAVTTTAGTRVVRIDIVRVIANYKFLQGARRQKRYDIKGAQKLFLGPTVICELQPYPVSKWGANIRGSRLAVLEHRFYHKS